MKWIGAPEQFTSFCCVSPSEIPRASYEDHVVRLVDFKSTEVDNGREHGHGEDARGRGGGACVRLRKREAYHRTILGASWIHLNVRL
jgi:hypothetical protein